MASDTSGTSMRTKPMRLGTKSCLECRRRKVRCTFGPQDAARCRQCLLHKVRCIPQGLPRPGQGDNETNASRQPWQQQLLTPPALEDYPRLRALLENRSSPYQAGPPYSGRYAGTSPADESAQPSCNLASVLESLLADEFHRLAGTQPSVSDQTTSDRIEGDEIFTSAPLLEYLRSTVIGVSPSTQSAAFSGPTPSLMGGSTGDVLAWQQTVLSLVPNHSTLQDVFGLTRPYWSIWPLSASFPTSVPDACTFLDRDLRDADIASCGHPGAAAKRLIWLALCTQQLPRTFLGTHPKAFVRYTPAQLVHKLLDVALELVHVCLESSKPNSSLDALEALCILYKCYMNMGCPRRGWKCSRQGIENALLLGLHRSSEQRKKAIWTCLWSHDRQMALFLGVPYAIPEHFLGLRGSHAANNNSSCVSIEQDILGKFMIVSGHILDRDQAESPSYSQTLRIAEELDKARDMIPSELWVLPRIDSGDQPVGVPFWKRTTVFFYHYLNSLLHLPFIIPGKQETKYRYSRDLALASAEGMLLAFRNIPTSNDGIPVVCDWLDFAAFSGAMTLVLDLLGDSSSSTMVQHHHKAQSISRRTGEEEHRLWALVLQFARDMRHKCEILDCHVPRQAAEVLEHLYAVQTGALVAADQYEVVIPYFGRICIKRPEFKEPQDHNPNTRQATQQGTYEPDPQCPSQQFNNDHCNDRVDPLNPINSQSTFVEFDLTNFGSTRQPWVGNTDFELGEDWAAASSTFDLNEVNWNQVFIGL